jgi:hypothetical protein
MASPPPSSYTDRVSRSSRTFVSRALLALLALPASCAEGPRSELPTRLLVAVWTDLQIPAQLDRIEANLRQETEELDTVRPLDPNGQDQPVVLELELGYLERLLPLDLLLVGRAGGLVVVQRRAVLPRLPPGTSALALTLEARCAGRACDPGWTCIRGLCRRADLPAESLVGSVDELPSDPLGTVVAGRRVTGCASDADCEDGDPCTVDICSDNRCNVEAADPCLLCATDEECASLTAEPCLVPYCHPYGVCRLHIERPGTRCDSDEDPCTVQCCREGTICMTFNTCAEPDASTGCDP